MHELSIVESIIDLSNKAVQEHGGSHVERIDLDIGQLAAIDMYALRFAWKHATPATVLAGSELHMENSPGEAECQTCELRFPVSTLYSPCPKCGGFNNRIVSGQDLMVKSLVIH